MELYCIAYVPYEYSKLLCTEITHSHSEMNEFIDKIGQVGVVATYILDQETGRVVNFIPDIMQEI